jgi:hypothetical protein
MKQLLIILAAVAMLGSTSNRDAYIIAADRNITFSSGTDISSFNAVRKRFGNAFVWVRRNGREFLIRDETFVLRARALFAPQLALAPDQMAVAREEAALDREEEQLDDAPRTAANERRLEEIRAKQREVARREQALDEREEELERAAGRELWPLIETAIRAGVAKPVR